MTKQTEETEQMVPNILLFSRKTPILITSKGIKGSKGKNGGTGANGSYPGGSGGAGENGYPAGNPTEGQNGENGMNLDTTVSGRELQERIEISLDSIGEVLQVPIGKARVVIRACGGNGGKGGKGGKGGQGGLIIIQFNLTIIY